jgi:hypothetical protein
MISRRINKMERTRKEEKEEERKKEKKHDFDIFFRCLNRCNQGDHPTGNRHFESSRPVLYT